MFLFPGGRVSLIALAVAGPAPVRMSLNAAGVHAQKKAKAALIPDLSASCYIVAASVIVEPPSKASALQLGSVAALPPAVRQMAVWQHCLSCGTGPAWELPRGQGAR